MKYNSIGEQLIAKAKELDPNYKPDKFNDMSEALDILLNNSRNGDNFIDLVIDVEQFESWVNPDTWNLTIPANNITTDMLLSIAQDDKKGILLKITMPHPDEEGQDVLCATIPFYCDFLTGAFFTNVTNIFGKIGCWIGSVDEVGQDQVFKFNTTSGNKIWYDLGTISETITQNQYDEIKALVDTNSLAGLAFKTLNSYVPLTISLDNGTFVFGGLGLGLESTDSDRKNALDDSSITIKSDLSVAFNFKEIFFPELTKNLSSQSIISVKTDGYQQNLTIGDGLTIENGVLKTTSSGGEKILNIPITDILTDTTKIQTIFTAMQSTPTSKTHTAISLDNLIPLSKFQNCDKIILDLSSLSSLGLDVGGELIFTKGFNTSNYGRAFYLTYMVGTVANFSIANVVLATGYDGTALQTLAVEQSGTN